MAPVAPVPLANVSVPVLLNVTVPAIADIQRAVSIITRAVVIPSKPRVNAAVAPSTLTTAVLPAVAIGAAEQGPDHHIDHGVRVVRFSVPELIWNWPPFPVVSKRLR